MLFLSFDIRLLRNYHGIGKHNHTQFLNRIASTEYEKTMDRNRERLEKTESSIFMHKIDNFTSPLVTTVSFLLYGLRPM